MAVIEFHTDKIPFKLPYPRKVSKWLQDVCRLENRSLASLTYIFCSEEVLLGLNKHYLRHSTYTDILSFDYSDDSQVIEGEIYISIPRVRENAREFHQDFDRELRRVMVHGLLHFVGYKDKLPKQKAQMRSKEEACLSLWK